MEERLAYHWDPMPASRKILMLLGVLLAFLWGEGFLGRALRAAAPGSRRIVRHPAPDSNPGASV